MVPSKNYALRLYSWVDPSFVLCLILLNRFTLIILQPNHCKIIDIATFHCIGTLNYSYVSLNYWIIKFLHFLKSNHWHRTIAYCKALTLQVSRCSIVRTGSIRLVILSGIIVFAHCLYHKWLLLYLYYLSVFLVMSYVISFRFIFKSIVCSFCLC